MKQIRLFSLAAIFLFLVAACSNENILEPIPASPAGVVFNEPELAMLYQMRGETRRVDLSQATRFAYDVIGFLDAEVATRSGNPRTIRSVAAMTFGKDKPTSTRTSEGKLFEFPDTLAYVFNYDDNEGYAIVAADKRINAPILAYCGGGSFSEENLKSNNPAMYCELQDVKAYAIECIARYEKKLKGVTTSVLQKLGLDNMSIDTRNGSNDNYYLYIVPPPPDWPNGTPTYSTNVPGNGIWNITEQVEPLLPVEWHQRFPFNNSVFNKDGSTNAPAGCTPVMLAQLMAYWQYPLYADGVYLNWNLLRNYTARPNAYPNVANKQSLPSSVDVNNVDFVGMVSALLEWIGENVGTSYSDKGSGTFYGYELPFLEDMGYNVGSGFRTYNYDVVINSLINQRPVIATGDAILNHEDGSHVWLIDGYIERQKTTPILVEVRRVSDDSIVCIYQIPETIVVNASYLHHNWGEEGNPLDTTPGGNAYIVAGSFFSENSDSLPSATRFSMNFLYNKQICPNIYH